MDNIRDRCGFLQRWCKLCLCCTVFLLMLWVTLTVLVPLSLDHEDTPVPANLTNPVGKDNTAQSTILVENTNFHQNRSISDFSVKCIH